MTEAEHRHTPARETTTSEVPAEVARYLDGTDLLAKTQALRLSTIDAAGWPHASLLSAGDMVNALAMASSRRPRPRARVTSSRSVVQP